MGTRHLGAAAAALALLFTAACSAAEPEAAAPSESRSTSSPSPTPALSREATIRAWLTALVEMQNTGETAAFLSLSSSSCTYCQEFSNQVRDVYAAGGEATAHPMKISALQPQEGTKDTFLAFFSAKGTTVRPSAGAKPQRFPGGPETYAVGLRKEKSSWQVTSFDRIMVSH